jgi:hypothetical protein
VLQNILRNKGIAEENAVLRIFVKIIRVSTLGFKIVWIDFTIGIIRI